MFMPDFDDVMEIHGDLVEMFRADADPIEPPGARDEDLVQSACLRPNTSVGDWDKYESLFEKAAALFHSLVQNRAFHNGNKRTALVTLLATLHRNGWILDSSVDDEAVYELTVAVANGGFPGQAGRLDPDAVRPAGHGLAGGPCGDLGECGASRGRRVQAAGNDSQVHGRAQTPCENLRSETNAAGRNHEAKDAGPCASASLSDQQHEAATPAVRPAEREPAMLRARAAIDTCTAKDHAETLPARSSSRTGGQGVADASTIP